MGISNLRYTACAITNVKSTSQTTQPQPATPIASNLVIWEYRQSTAMSDAARLKATVYVGGLDSAVSELTLHAAFIPFGDIVEISLPKPELKSSNELHRGFGYVEFELAEDAKEAIDNMDQSELFGRVIKCSEAKPQKNQNEGLGSKTAVWEQVSCFVAFVQGTRRYGS
jgi:RNA recognition motif-containing protein